MHLMIHHYNMSVTQSYLCFLSCNTCISFRFSTLHMEWNIYYYSIYCLMIHSRRVYTMRERCAVNIRACSSHQQYSSPGHRYVGSEPEERMCIYKLCNAEGELLLIMPVHYVKGPLQNIKMINFCFFRYISLYLLQMFFSLYIQHSIFNLVTKRQYAIIMSHSTILIVHRLSRSIHVVNL